MSRRSQIISGYGLDASKPALRRAVIDWIVASKCDHAITLAFNRPLPLGVAMDRLKAWFWQLEKHIFACCPNRVPPHKRLAAFIVPEHQATNIHFHLAVRLIDGSNVTPANVGGVVDVAKRLWTSAQPYGSVEIKRVDDDRGWARYITKDCYKLGIELILSHDFHPLGKRRSRGKRPAFGDRPVTKRANTKDVQVTSSGSSL